MPTPPAIRASLLAAATILAGAAISAGPAGAGGAPVAIVEDVGTGVSQVSPMDLLSAGDRIELAPDQSIIIGYFSTCTRDFVHGGTVTVQPDGSQVEGGEIQSQKMKCAAGTMDLTAEQLAQSAALAYRDPNSNDPLQPQTTVDSTQPVIVAPDLKEVVLEDLRRHEKRTLTLDADGMGDFAALGITLRPGGVYVVSGGKRALVFKVDGAAVAAPLPILVRLIRL